MPGNETSAELAAYRKLALEPGVYPGIDWETYASWDAARSSILTKFARSPRHARAAMLDPQQPTDAMDLGTAIHCAVLEPKRFSEEYVGAPQVDRRTKAGKETWAQLVADHPHATVLKAGQFNVCQRVKESIWREPWAEGLLAGKGFNELSGLWLDPEFDVPCKLRVDRLVSEWDGWPTVVDLKTTTDASSEAFRRSIARYAYHLQAAYYRDGLQVLSDVYRRWIWIVVETEPPFAAALYEPTDEMLEEGRRLYKSGLAQLVECQKSGLWPGYPPTPTMLDLPPWARTSRFEGDDL